MTVVGEGTRGERDAWTLGLRGARNAIDPGRVVDAFVEEERAADGTMAPVATLFLANRECPFRCLMCDLWKNTLLETVAPGVIPQQIRAALEQLPPARQIKLYNSGSFFDPRAVPRADDAAIASLIRGFDRVIVECHPALLGRRCLEFRDRLSCPLEVAIGLETAHPQVLEQLNKRMTRESFCRAAAFLAGNGIALRVFILLRPPFLSEEEGLEWAIETIDFAFDAGASVCTVIPTRAGNGVMEQLALEGHFHPPSIESLEATVEYGIGTGRGRVFADLWDLERFSSCAACFPARQARLNRMNREQVVPAGIACDGCGPGR